MDNPKIHFIFPQKTSRVTCQGIYLIKKIGKKIKANCDVLYIYIFFELRNNEPKNILRRDKKKLCQYSSLANHNLELIRENK